MKKTLNSKLFKLWSNPNFIGAFSGARNFWLALKNEKGIKASYKDVTQFLDTVPEHKMLAHKAKTLTTRQYRITKNFKVAEADIATLQKVTSKKKGSYTYFLLIVDCNSRYIWTFLLKDKT